MTRSITKLTIRGYKSIRALEDFELGDVNILIGGNGCGKSNFVGFFAFLREMIEGRLQLAVNLAGGSDKHLFLGPKVTTQIEGNFSFNRNGYQFALQPTASGNLVFLDERIRFMGDVHNVDRSIGSGHHGSPRNVMMSCSG